MWTSGWWDSADGLRLHYRDYPGSDHRPPIVCLPGLTRNARDFEPLAERFAGKWRVLCVELRGRGESEYAKDASTYTPPHYLADLKALFDQAGIDRFVAVGTSLGGILTMLLAHADPARIAGAVINDIGPVLEPAGLAQIMEYVGQGRSFPTWMHAARALREVQGETYPDLAIEDWLRLAKRSMELGGNGRIAFDYDMHIADPLQSSDGAVTFDLWPGLEALAGRPLLFLRGALSNLLSEETFAEMERRLPMADFLTVPRVGHIPTFEEPGVLDAVERMLAKV